MGSVFGEQVELGVDVLAASKARIRHAYSVADTVVVCFSGGKDSTVLLNLALEVATELNRLPLKVFFADEEAIYPETVDYVRRVMQRPGIDLLWSCVPIKHRNACSRSQPWYYTWNPEEEAKWCRPLPEWAKTHRDYPQVPWSAIVEQIGHYYPASLGTVVQLLGRRSQESLTRWRMIAMRDGVDAYLSRNTVAGFRHLLTGDPLYDWRTEDIWLAPALYGWDYCRAYDVLSKMGIPPSAQRLAPPFGEEPARLLWSFKVGWPELWDRMQTRVEGADVAARYFNTELYGRNDNSVFKPGDGELWEDYVTRLLMLWPPDTRRGVAEQIARVIRWHDDKCLAVLGRYEPIPEEQDHVVTGVSWKKLAKVAFRGVLKQRTLAAMFGFAGTGEDGKRRQKR